MKRKRFLTRIVALVLSFVLMSSAYAMPVLAALEQGVPQSGTYNDYVPDDVPQDYTYREYVPDGILEPDTCCECTPYNMPQDCTYDEYAVDEEADPEDYFPPSGEIGIVPFGNVTVTFDGNGAPGQNETRNATLNTAFGNNFPVPPDFPGFAFRHWNTEPSLPGTLFSSNTVVTGDMTVYAQWGREVRFYTNIPGIVTPHTIVVPNGYSVSCMPGTPNIPAVMWPADPVRPGFIFKGWHTHFQLGEGEPYCAETIINGQRTLHAQWESDGIPPYKVNFNLNGGELTSSSLPCCCVGIPYYRLKYRYVRPGTSIYLSYDLNQYVPDANRAPDVRRIVDHAFNGNLSGSHGHLNLTGWHSTLDANDNSLQFGLPWWSGEPLPIPITSEMVDYYGHYNVYARWVYEIVFRAHAPSEPNRFIDVRHVVVTPETLVGGGSIAEWGTDLLWDIQYIPNIGTYRLGQIYQNRSLPTATRPGFVFSGWWNMQLPLNATDEEIEYLGARELFATCLINSSGYAYALWRFSGGNGGVPDDNKVVFDLNGGYWTVQDHEKGYRHVPAGSTIQLRWGAGWSDIAANSNLPPMPRHPTKPGYLFTGWFVGPTPFPTEPTTGAAALRDGLGGGGRRFDGNSHVPAGGLTVYARWLPYYIVTFDTNGGTLSSTLAAYGNTRRVPHGWTVNQFSTVIGGAAQGAPHGPYYFAILGNTAKTRGGHVVVGWNTAADGSGTVWDSNTPVTDHITVYTMWARRIWFNSNHSYLGGTDLTQVRNVLSGRTIGDNHLHPNAPNAPLTLPSIANWPELNASNHDFVGWNTRQDGTGTWLDETTRIASIDTILTVWAVWDTGVVFRPGVAPMSSIQDEDRRRPVNFEAPYPGEALEDWPPPPVWPEHWFRGWNTCPNGNLTWVNYSTPIRNRTTLYALWDARVIFDPQGGTLTGLNEHRRHIGWTIGALEFPSATLPGRTLLVWLCPQGQPFTATTPVPRSITVTAQWGITFDANHGETPATSAQPIIIGDSYAAAMGSPDVAALTIRDGYDFVGWFTTREEGGVQVSGVDVNKASYVLYARWTAVPVSETVNVTFNENHGASPATSTQPVTVGETYAAAMGHAAVVALTTRDGYDFVGWFTTPADGGVQVLADTTVTNTVNHTLYARWTADSVSETVNVTFNENHGTAPATSTQPVTVGETYAAAMGHAAVVALTTRNGYDFVGWFTTPADGGVQVLADTTVTNTVNHTLYARWTADSVSETVNVTFNENHGATPATSTQPVTVGGTYAIAMNHAAVVVLTSRPNSGLTFAGWWTTPEGDGVQVFAGTEVTKSENHTLYARWIDGSVSVTVTFNENHGATPTTSTQPVTVSGTYAIAMGHADVVALTTRTGFTFAGWWTTPALGGIQVSASDVVTITVNHTLYARWTADSDAPPPPPLPPPLPPGSDTSPPASTVPYIPWQARDRQTVVYVAYEADDEAPELVPIAPMSVSPIHHAYMIGFAEDGTIRPNANITRAEVVTIFFRLISDNHRANIWSQTNSFVDVALARWFNNPISTMENGGLLTGIPLDANFNPNQAATRAEFAAMVVNYLGLGHYRVTGGHAFTDIEGHWASDAINVAYIQGWVRGFGDGTFRPDQLITRAEVAAFVNRALNRLPETVDDLLDGMVTWPDNMNQNAWYFLYIQEATNCNHHEMKACEVYKTWVELITPRDWRALERPYSTPWCIN